MQYNENGEFIADDINFRFTLGSQYVSVETFYNLGLHIPTLSQRLEAARREIAERSLLINDKINRVIYYDDVFYTCSICGRGSTNVGLILNHDCN